MANANQFSQLRFHGNFICRLQRMPASHAAAPESLNLDFGGQREDIGLQRCLLEVDSAGGKMGRTVDGHDVPADLRHSYHLLEDGFGRWYSYWGSNVRLAK